jgi:hypothetical protein
MSRLFTTDFSMPNSWWPFSARSAAAPTWDNTNLTWMYFTNNNRNATITLANLPGGENLSELYFKMALGNWHGSCGLLYFLSFSTDKTSNLVRLREAGHSTPVNIYLNGVDRPELFICMGFSRYKMRQVELHLKLHNENGLIEYMINGKKATWTGNTAPNADTKFTTILISPAYEARLGDIALNTPSGDTDNSWVGNRYFGRTRPNKAGSLTQWTPNTGENWAAVDEVSNTNDGDTTYVATEDVDKIDLYGVGPVSASPIGDPCYISGIDVKGQGRKTVSEDAQTVALGFKIGDTYVWGPQSGLTTAYDDLADWIEPAGYTKINPVTSENWTLDDLANIEIGIKSG